MCQACLLLASRRAGEAAPAEGGLGARRPARFTAQAEWVEAPEEPEAKRKPSPKPQIDADRG